MTEKNNARNSFVWFSSNHFGLATTGVFFLMLIAIVLHILDRQGDFVARTDFLWKAKLKTEQEEVETMRGINKVTFYYISFFNISVGEWAAGKMLTLWPIYARNPTNHEKCV